MEFNVAQLLKGPVGGIREYEIADSLAEIAEIAWVGPVTGKVRIIRTNRGVLVRAHLESTVGADCSRCLVPFEYPLRIDFEEEFLPTLDVETGLPIDIGAEDSSAFAIDEKHILDLREAVRQYALLVQPMQPLCQPECQGLCPVCGANLNLASCRCPREPVDRPWAALSALVSASDDEKGAS